eukprot:244800_1
MSESTGEETKSDFLNELSYIVGDVGATNARLELWHLEVDKAGNFKEAQVATNTFQTKKFSSLTAVVLEFLDDVDREHYPKSACFAVAGPKVGTQINLTNVGWTVDEIQLSKELQIDHLKLMNDFVGCGYGLLDLSESDLIPLSSNVEPQHGAPKAIIGAGTGLGEAILTYDGSEYVVWPGEGGHSDFASRSLQEFNLLQDIKESLNITRVSVERVVSGQGIANIYWYLTRQHPKIVNDEISKNVMSAKQPASVIGKNALGENADTLCLKALEMFVSAYGAEAGNVGIRLLPYGGIYIAGGIAMKQQILDLLKKGNFIRSFHAKGRMRKYLEKMPVYVVSHPNIGMLGARVVARRELRALGYKLEKRLEETMLECV